MLNRFNDINYGDVMPVFLDNNSSNVIGTCQITLNKSTGLIFTDLNLNSEISLDLYVYYFISIDDNGCCTIETVVLNSKQKNDKPTRKLKEMIVK